MNWLKSSIGAVFGGISAWEARRLLSFVNDTKGTARWGNGFSVCPLYELTPVNLSRWRGLIRSRLWKAILEFNTNQMHRYCIQIRD